MSDKNYCKDCKHHHIDYHYCYLDRDYKSLNPENKICVKFEPKTPPTVFERITVSPETLAEQLVYWDQNPPNSGWISNLIRRGGYKTYRTKLEAIAATLEKLKEVADEQ